jgi:hypothetical protein
MMPVVVSICALNGLPEKTRSRTGRPGAVLASPRLRHYIACIKDIFQLNIYVEETEGMNLIVWHSFNLHSSQCQLLASTFDRSVYTLFAFEHHVVNTTLLAKYTRELSLGKHNCSSVS